MTISRSIHVSAIFFIHSSVDGHLGCFLVLAVVNSAAVNIGVRATFQIMVLSRYMHRSGLLVEEMERETADSEGRPLLNLLSIIGTLAAKHMFFLLL